MSLIKPVEIRVTVAPVSISKFVITPFTFALINIPASGASLCTPTEPGVLSDVTGVVSEGHKIQFNIQGQIGCYRVTVSETVVMPPQSEIVVNGKVNDRFPILFKVGLVEPTEDFRKSDKALVGRTLCLMILVLPKSSSSLAKICENVCKRCFTFEPCSRDRSWTDCSNKSFK
jgi:hypothetical protein